MPRFFAYAPVVPPTLPVVWAALSRDARRRAWGPAPDAVSPVLPPVSASLWAPKTGGAVIAPVAAVIAPVAGAEDARERANGFAVALVKALLATASVLVCSFIGWAAAAGAFDWYLDEQSDWSVVYAGALPVAAWLGSAVWLGRRVGRDWGWALLACWPVMFPLYVYRQNRGSAPRARSRPGPAAKFPTAATSAALLLAALAVAMGLGAVRAAELAVDDAAERPRTERTTGEPGDARSPSNEADADPAAERPLLLLPTLTPEPTPESPAGQRAAPAGKPTPAS